MKNEKVQVVFTLPENEQKELRLSYFEMCDSYLDGRKLKAEDAKGWLILKKHRFLQSRFILHEVFPFALLCFHENGDFESVVISNSNVSGRFETLQSADCFVLLPLEVFVALRGIKQLNYKRP